MTWIIICLLCWLFLCLVGAGVAGLFKAATPNDWLHWVIVPGGAMFVVGALIGGSIWLAVWMSLG